MAVVEGKLAYSYLRQPPGGFDQPSGWQQAYGHLSLKDYHWGRGVLAASAGDQSFQLSLLPGAVHQLLLS